MYKCFLKALTFNYTENLWVQKRKMGPINLNSTNSDQTNPIQNW